MNKRATLWSAFQDFSTTLVGFLIVATAADMAVTRWWVGESGAFTAFYAMLTMMSFVPWALVAGVVFAAVGVVLRKKEIEISEVVRT